MQRELAAFIVAALYAAFCIAIYLREQRRRRIAEEEIASLLPASAPTDPIWVVFGTQTGQAEEIAGETARTLHTAGLPVQLRSISDIGYADLLRARRVLFIVSTYGEGDPPDAAALFAQDVMDGRNDAPLMNLHIGVLALGDSNYASYCGFGRTLDDWLRRQGARPLFDRIDVDKSSTETLLKWRHHLSRLAGTADLPDWEGTRFDPWLITTSRLLNAGSRGLPVFHLELLPPEGTPLPGWEAGDLVQIDMPGKNERPREYSIASVPADGSIHLVVRRSLRTDGTPGMASARLTQGMPEQVVPLRLRTHPSFRAGTNASRPFILIGNGTGIAGLRAHLKQRALKAPASKNWLIFGERQSAHDALYRCELEAWLADGILTRLDWAYSQDQAEKRYVQHVLHDAANTVREWIDTGAAIYVCGSLEGMASEVDAKLRQILGTSTMDQLLAERRYCRDVY